jgi:hypothetical protein
VRRPCAPRSGDGSPTTTTAAPGATRSTGPRRKRVRRRPRATARGARLPPSVSRSRTSGDALATSRSETEIVDRDARQRRRPDASRGGRLGPARHRPGPPSHRDDEQERARALAKPRLHPRSVPVAEAVGKVQVPILRLDRQRAAAADAGQSRPARPEEPRDRALAAPEQGRAGGARLRVGGEHRLE